MAKEFIAKGLYGIPDGPTSQISPGARKAMQANDPDAYNTLIQHEKEFETGEPTPVVPISVGEQPLFRVKEEGELILLIPTKKLLVEANAPTKPVEGEKVEKSVAAAPAPKKAAPAPAKKKATPATKAAPAKPAVPVSAVNKDVVVAEGSVDTSALANDPTVLP